MKLWNCPLKALRTKALIKAPVLVQKENKLRLGKDAGLKVLGSVYVVVYSS